MQLSAQMPLPQLKTAYGALQANPEDQLEAAEILDNTDENVRFFGERNIETLRSDQKTDGKDQS